MVHLLSMKSQEKHNSSQIFYSTYFTINKMFFLVIPKQIKRIVQAKKKK